MPPSSEPKKLDASLAQLKPGPIPAGAAVSPAVRDYDNQKVVLSFEAYKQNQCRIFKLDKGEAKHLTTELRKISTTLTKHFRHQHSSAIACKPVYRSGEYGVLFDGLPPDVDEILEIDYTRAGRIFGFLLMNTFNVVAVAKEHLR